MSAASDRARALLAQQTARREAWGHPGNDDDRRNDAWRTTFGVVGDLLETLAAEVEALEAAVKATRLVSAALGRGVELALPELDAANAEAARLRAALEAIQWRGGDDADECPECCGIVSIGHRPACRVGTALRGSP